MEAPVSQGLSIADNVLANYALLNLNRNQAALGRSVTRLSSGLRINSAADDPSGLAIAEGLTSQARGFDQAASNIRTANNALTVADGAVAAITRIIQRIRTLAIEAASDFNSDIDRADLQAEVDQLILEVNRISQNTNFNGIQLLNSAALSDPVLAKPVVTQQGTGIVNATGSVLTVTLPAAPTPGDVLVAGIFYFFPDGPPVAPPGWTVVDNIGTMPFGGYATYTHVVQAGDPAAYSWSFANPEHYSGSIVEVAHTDDIDPVDVHGVQAQAGPGASLATTPTVTPSSSDDIGIAFTGIDFPGPPTTATTTPGWTELSYLPNSFHQILTQTNTNLTEGVPVSAGTEWSIPTVFTVGGAILLMNPFTQGAASLTLDVQNGANEGDHVPVNLPHIDSAILGISGIDITTFSSAEVAIGTCDVALTTILQSQAQLGAQMVSLSIDEDSANVASLNLTRAESTIRDLDVAQETVTFTRLQILVQVGTSILAQANVNPGSVLILFA